MTGEPGFRLHPLAVQDIIGIWEYIAEDNALAARRVREEILSKIRATVLGHASTGCLPGDSGVRCDRS